MHFFCSRVLSRIRLVPAAQAIHTFQGADADRNGCADGRRRRDDRAFAAEASTLQIVNDNERVRMVRSRANKPSCVRNVFKPTLRLATTI